MKTTRTIEEYLSNSLSDYEREELEKLISADLELADLVKLHDEVNQSIRDEGLFLLKHRLEEISGNYIKKKTVIRYLAVAAVFLFLILSFSLRFIFPYNIDPSRLFEKYYRPFETNIITRSTTELSLFEQGILEYQLGHYSEALKIFRALDEKRIADNNMLYFYLGLAFLGNEEFTDASSMFSIIPRDWNNPHKVHRDWYMALTYIAMGRTDQAGPILSEIAGNEGIYSREASVILKKL